MKTKCLSLFTCLVMIFSLVVFVPIDVGIEANAAVTLKSSTIRDYVLKKVGNSYPNGYCLKFVEESYQNLGAYRAYHCCAYKSGSTYIKSSSSTNIPVGATVYFGNCGGGPCRSCGASYFGHVGIYVGDGQFVHATGGKVQKSSLSSWSNKYRGWGCCGGFNLVPEDECNCSTSYAGQYTVTTSQYPLTMRSGHSTSSSQITTIPKGTTVTVSKANGTWAHVTYNGKSGLCSMQYLTKKQGDKPIYKSISVSKSLYTINENVVINIDATNYQKLTIGIDKEGKGRVVTKDIGNSYSFSAKDLGVGSYSAYVTVSNSNGYVDTNRVYFTIVEPVNLGNEFSAIVLNTKCWKPIQNTNSNNRITLTTEKRENYDKTLWKFKRNSNGSYTIQSYYDGQLLDSEGFSDVNGGAVISCVANGGTNQQWYIYNCKNGYSLKPVYAQRVLDLTNYDTNDGAKINLWDANSSDAQVFSIYKMDGNRDKLDYKISASKTTCNINEKVNVTIGGGINYVYNYKFYIVAPDGKETVVDNKCNLTYSFSANKTGKYVVYAEIKNPLYTQKGSKTSRCVTIEVKCNHNYGSWTTSKNATCTTDGTQVRKCSVCGNTETQTIKAFGHKYDGGKITTNATCVADGVKTFTCTTCKATKTEKVAKTGHKYTESVVAPTCTTDGYTLHTCSNCKDSYKDNTVKAVGHKYDEGKITTPATCTQDGVKTFTCTTCKATKTETVAKLGHSYTETVIKPTCLEKGYTNHVCSVCGDSYKDSETDIIPHDYEEKETPATCLENGEKKFVCKNCGDTKTEEIPAIGHEFEDTVVKPTKSSDGYTSHKCLFCDYEYRDNFTPYVEPDALMGDVNGDGRITTLDALDILKHIVGLSTLDENQLISADLTGDGNITSSDALQILMIVVGLT